jgi:hypothetical protein
MLGCRMTRMRTVRINAPCGAVSHSMAVRATTSAESSPRGGRAHQGHTRRMSSQPFSATSRSPGSRCSPAFRHLSTLQPRLSGLEHVDVPWMPPEVSSSPRASRPAAYARDDQGVELAPDADGLVRRDAPNGHAEMSSDDLGDPPVRDLAGDRVIGRSRRSSLDRRPEDLPEVLGVDIAVHVETAPDVTSGPSVATASTTWVNSMCG